MTTARISNGPRITKLRVYAPVSAAATSAASDTGDSLRALWSERVRRSRAIAQQVLEERGAAALGDMHESWSGRVSLRWIITHMVEEYARYKRPRGPAARSSRRLDRRVTSDR